MKDSGIDWIGEIPEGWKIVKLKDISVLKKGEVFDSSNAKPDGLYPYINGGIKPSDYSDNYNVKENSIAVSEGGASAGYSQFVESKFWAGTHCYVVTPKYKNIKKYIYYILKGFSGQIMMEKTGSALPNLQKTRFSNFIVSYTPVLETQQKIADYLDIEVTKLDKQISLLEKKHVLLGDYKEALIFETVTKGLDKNTTMKDSGIDWIGEIPEGWKVKRVKDILRFPTLNKAKENSKNYLEIGDVNVNTNDYNVSDKEKLSVENAKQAKKGMLIISTVRPARGGITIIKEDCPISSAFCVVDIKGNKYWYYLIKNKLFLNQLSNLNTGVTYPTCKDKDIYNQSSCVPPLETQKQISDYLDIEVTKLDKQRELIKKKVELLKQYKEALIFEVVTGKKEVE
jgi:type I restriction enzyme S subunit